MNSIIQYFEVMYHQPAIFPAISKILELIATNPKASAALLPQLMSIKNELIGNNRKENLFNQMTPRELDNENDMPPLANIVIPDEEEDNSNERRFLTSFKDTMRNYGAINFLEKLQSDNRMNTSKLRQLTVILANKTGIDTQANQFKTTEQIYRWIDANWDIIEPRTSELILVFCDGK